MPLKNVFDLGVGAVKKGGKDLMMDKLSDTVGYKGKTGSGFSKKGMLKTILGHGMNKSFQAALKQRGVPEAVMTQGLQASLIFLTKNEVFQEAILVRKPTFDLLQFIKDTGYGASIPMPKDGEEEEEIDWDDDDNW